MVLVWLPKNSGYLICSELYSILARDDMCGSSSNCVAGAPLASRILARPFLLLVLDTINVVLGNLLIFFR